MHHCVVRTEYDKRQQQPRRRTGENDGAEAIQCESIPPCAKVSSLAGFSAPNSGGFVKARFEKPRSTRCTRFYNLKQAAQHIHRWFDDVACRALGRQQRQGGSVLLHLPPLCAFISRMCKQSCLEDKTRDGCATPVPCSHQVKFDQPAGTDLKTPVPEFFQPLTSETRFATSRAANLKVENSKHCPRFYLFKRIFVPALKPV